MSCEMGKPILQSRAETTYAAEIGRANIEVGKHLYGEVLCDSSEGYEDHVVMAATRPWALWPASSPSTILWS